MEKYKKIDGKMHYREEKKEMLKKYNLKHKTNYKYISEAIEKIYLSGESALITGNCFEVNKNTVYLILKKLSVERRSKGGPNGKVCNLSDEEIKYIRQSGKTQKELAPEFNVSSQTIGNIIRGFGKWAKI